MSDDTTPPAQRPAFDALVCDLRALVKEQDIIAKAEAARCAGTEVMRRAADLFAAGRITGAELTRLHAVWLRLEAQLPLPGGRE